MGVRLPSREQNLASGSQKTLLFLCIKQTNIQSINRVSWREQLRKNSKRLLTEGDFKERLKNTDLKETETLLDNCVRCL